MARVAAVAYAKRKKPAPTLTQTIAANSSVLMAVLVPVDDPDGEGEAENGPEGKIPFVELVVGAPVVVLIATVVVGLTCNVLVKAICETRNGGTAKAEVGGKISLTALVLADIEGIEAEGKGNDDDGASDEATDGRGV